MAVEVEPASFLSPADGLALVDFARGIVRARLEGTGAPAPPVSSALSCARGAFVSIHRGAMLRGCIGHLRSTRSVVEVVAECAISAAFTDPRFPPLDRTELDGVVFEVSVLSTLEAVRPADVEVGRDGVVLSAAKRTAVFLPQVARDLGWDRETLFAELCRKAGLAPTVWRSSQARLERFTAEVYRELTDAEP